MLVSDEVNTKGRSAYDDLMCMKVMYVWCMWVVVWRTSGLERAEEKGDVDTM